MEFHIRTNLDRRLDDALGVLQDQMVTSCALQTPCSRRARLLRILTIECLEQLTVIDATDVTETFLRQLARWESGALSVHDRSSQF